MFGSREYKLLNVLICIAWLSSACGAPSQDQSAISTAVAQTVQARDSLTEVVSIPTTTPEINSGATATGTVISTSAPTLASAPSDPNCIGATLVAETPPDGV